MNTYYIIQNLKDGLYWNQDYWTDDIEYAEKFHHKNDALKHVTNYCTIIEFYLW